MLAHPPWPASLPPTLLLRISHMECGCWRWTGEINRNGYGRVWWQGKRIMVHKLIYTLVTGRQIPPTVVLDHVRERGCTRRDCCNPAYLEPVSHRENTRRGKALLFRPKGA